MEEELKRTGGEIPDFGGSRPGGNLTPVSPSPVAFLQRNPLLIAGGAAALAWWLAPKDQRVLWTVVAAVGGYVAAAQVLPRLIR